MKPMTMKELSELLEVPYGIIRDATWDMRGGTRQRGHNIQYDLDELRPFLLNRIEARIDSAEETLSQLHAMKRNVELEGLEAMKA